jgi:predicted AlkP superfamily pyrophosphatase or phosphodiesterase
VDRVLAISVDGLNPRAITKLGRSGAPAFHRLMREGAWTFNARTERGQTRTLPNHTAMLTGRRINARAGGHGVTFNRDSGGTVHTAAGHNVASVFGVVHDHGGSTALYAAKKKFRFFARTWNTHGGPDTVGANNGRAKMDKVLLAGNAGVVKNLNKELKKRPRTFTFLHLSLPDSAGHRYGFMSPRYLRAVKQTDRLLGTLLTTVAGKPALRKHMLVVLTSDHGGSGSGHDDPSRLQNYRVPFMAWGPGVPAGRNLYAINPTFRDPGRSRPGYRGRQPIRNGDVANLVTDVLDLPPVPGSEFNRPQSLDLFRR